MAELMVCYEGEDHGGSGRGAYLGFVKLIVIFGFSRVAFCWLLLHDPFLAAVISARKPNLTITCR